MSELTIAKEKAEESDRLKSAFLANMSHEIRTPMNDILGFSELLKTPNLSPEKQQKYIEIIEKSGSRMLTTINDIIDISKIEAKIVTIYNKDVNISEQINEIFFEVLIAPSFDSSALEVLTSKKNRILLEQKQFELKLKAILFLILMRKYYNNFAKKSIIAFY